MSLRLDALSVWQGWEKSGLLYLWNGKLVGTFPDVRWAYGPDCSGFCSGGIYVATRGKVDHRTTWNADEFRKRLPVTTTPKPGDFALYGRPDHANHIMVWVGDGRVLGACGGDQGTTSQAIAISRGARVRYRPKADYRLRREPDGSRVSDFLGFRVNTFLDAA